MEQKNYLQEPDKDCLLSSSRAVSDYCRRADIEVQTFPLPGIGCLTEHENQEEYFVWRFENERGINLLPMFKEQSLSRERTKVLFRQMKNGEIFLNHNKLYEVFFDKKRGYYLQHIFMLCNELYARAEAITRGFDNVEFVLCRVYVIGKTQEFLGICWVGYVPATGDRLFVKLFQADVDKFMQYDLRQLAWEAINVGELFHYKNKWWKLLEDEEEVLRIEEVTVCPQMQVLRNDEKEQAQENNEAEQKSAKIIRMR